MTRYLPLKRRIICCDGCISWLHEVVFALPPGNSYLSARTRFPFFSSLCYHLHASRGDHGFYYRSRHRARQAEKENLSNEEAFLDDEDGKPAKDHANALKPTSAR